MKKIMHLLMLSCKKATELIEKKSLVGLSFQEKFQLRIHKSMCDACSSYEKQSLKIDMLLKNQKSDMPGSENNDTNPHLKDRIIKKLP